MFAQKIAPSCRVRAEGVEFLSEASVRYPKHFEEHYRGEHANRCSEQRKREASFARFLPGGERQGYGNQRSAHEEVDQKWLETGR